MALNSSKGKRDHPSLTKIHKRDAKKVQYDKDKAFEYPNAYI